MSLRRYFRLFRRCLLLMAILCAFAIAAVAGGRAGTAQPPLTFLYRSAADSDIVLMDVDRAHLHNLTRHPAADRDPVWSPDGRHLAFVSDRGGQAQLYVWEIGSTHDPQPLVPSRIAPGYRPIWSPDGRYMAVEFFRGTVEIYIIDLTCVRANPPCPITRLSDSQTDDRFPVWSPDGERIAYVSWLDGDAEIYSVRVDGSDLRNLTRSGGWDVSPSWSPDGRQIAFFSDRDRYRELYVMNADGSNLRMLTDDNSPQNAQAAGAPAWSPDGRWLAYGFTFEGNIDVMVIPADCADGQTNLQRCRETMRRVAPSAANDIAPFWSSDSRSINFISDRQGKLAIFRVPIDCPRCAPEMLTSAHYDSVQASWRPRP
jgi:Tol biopolymer transport system component